MGLRWKSVNTLVVVLGSLYASQPSVLAQPITTAQVGGVELPGLPLAITDPRRPVKPSGTETPASLRPTATQPSQLVDPAANGQRGSVALTPLTLRAEPGVARVIPISIRMVNQIVVPFTNVDVKTVNEADISVAGNSVFVATESTGAIGMIITDGANYADAITLTLIPQDIPPRQIRISLAGQTVPATPQGATQVQAGNPTGRAPYQESLTTTLRHVALGQVPAGYAIADPDATVGCRSALRMVPAQLLEGGRLRIHVLAAINPHASPMEFVESDCYAHGVLAVAAWPHVRLEPGEQTEVFIVTHNAEPTERLNPRPAVRYEGAP